MNTQSDQVETNARIEARCVVVEGKDVNGYVGHVG